MKTERCILSINKTLGGITYTLNLFDLLCTLCVLRLGVVELNPFMKNVPFMVFWKTMIVGVSLLWLSHRPERTARIGLWVCMVGYTILSIYHLMNGGILWM